MNTSKRNVKQRQNQLKLHLSKNVHEQELEFMKPMLEDAARETAQTMEQIAVDTKVAEETKVVVQREETQAGEKAKETQAIADDAQKDLNEALPALDAALNSLRSLNKNDVVEVGGPLVVCNVCGRLDMVVGRFYEEKIQI